MQRFVTKNDVSKTMTALMNGVMTHSLRSKFTLNGTEEKRCFKTTELGVRFLGTCINI